MAAFWQLILENRGKALGIAGGLLFGLLFLTVGFFKTIAFSVFVATGYYIGRKFDNEEDIGEVLDRILPGKFTKR
ncbi:DUF2273 domain-containing protein [Aneurinibacillus uraniidurans]|uniref:DUF2273 domain-containing protein n=1 Tax=Aneurinibacillus uraniidurans TaxID=2966586 RepID=UPI002349D4D8|nr:DUF2273 domain-containing protein [Aneurinibacillus sp. B1]WCN38932.1 DUF2273 domain-containing protein [Aneurinibacillus sp. B1]